MTNHINLAGHELPLITMKAAATVALCSVKTIREEIKRKRLRAYRIGHRILIKPEDFDSYIQGREITHLGDGVSAKPVSAGTTDGGPTAQALVAIPAPASTTASPARTTSSEGALDHA